MISGGSGTSNLVKALVADFETSDGRTAARDGVSSELKGLDPKAMTTRAVDVLRHAGVILDTKVPEEASAVKSWLMTISTSAAEASNEGGFLGFGGVKVSAAEKATLADIRSALNL